MSKRLEENTLYRKYRPQSFDEVLGQEMVVSALKKAVEKQEPSHAYLFYGTRGCGKTSLARIFSKALKTAPEDLYELDAASNRGIAEIRQIRDSLETLPLKSKYKIYIIDEAHMLTKEAFNALLKSLEEPPRHIIFILATTEKHKIPSTILSRCQIFDFKVADSESIKKLLESVSEKEGFVLDNKVLQKISELAKGSFRDALSLLQKVLTYFDKKKISYGNFKESPFFSENFLEKDFLKALDAKNKERVFSLYREIKKKREILHFFETLTEQIRKSLLLRNSKDFEDFFSESMNKEEIDFLLSLKNISSFHLKKILEIRNKSFYSLYPEEAFEIFLFELFDGN